MDQKNDQTQVALIKSFSKLVEITPATIIFHREILQTLRENVLDMYSQERIDTISKQVDELIDAGNINMIEVLYKQSNYHLSNLKDLPKLLKDKAKQMEIQALADVKQVAGELRSFAKEVERTLASIKDQVMNPMIEKRRDNYFENISLPIIEQVIDEISKEDQFEKVDFSLFRLTLEDEKNFRKFSYSKDSIYMQAKMIIRTFADQEKLKIIAIEKQAQDEYIIQLREKSLQSELDKINLENGTNIAFHTGSSSLRQGAYDDQIVAMWKEMANQEVVRRQKAQEVQNSSGNIDQLNQEEKSKSKKELIIFRVEFELEDVQHKTGLINFFERHNLKFKEL